MLQQLIYTSAPVGLVPGRSGFCTVARSASMREAVALQLEQLSYYQHSSSKSQGHPIFSYRTISIRGAKFHALTRVQDSGLDFTGRPNFIAHHVVISSEEIGSLPTPAVICRDWKGWCSSWDNESQLFNNEDWSSLLSLTKSELPARCWESFTEDSVNAYALFENDRGLTLCVDGLPETTVLTLFAEAAELLEIRDPRKDFRVAAWNYTFSTRLQDQDTLGDFRWRCVLSESVSSTRIPSGDCIKVASLRATKVNQDESAFAREGWRSPQFVAQPKNVQITEGGTAVFEARADAIPPPSYQWYKVTKSGDRQEIAGETNSRIAIKNAGRGKTEYELCAWNRVDKVFSNRGILEVEIKEKLSITPAIPVKPKIIPDPKSWPDEEPSSVKNATKRISSGLVSFLVAASIGVTIIAVFLLRSKFLGPYNVRLTTNEPTFSVRASSLFPLSYQWIRNAENIPDATNSSYTTTDVGKYCVVISNWAASVTSSPSEVMQETLPNPKLMSAKQSSSQKLLAPDSTHDISTNGNSHADTSSVKVSTLKQSTLPAGWTKMVIGTTNADVVSLDINDPQGRFELSAAAQGVLATGDSILFFGRKNFGDAFAVRLLNIKSGIESSRFGIMLRESDKSNANCLFLGTSPNSDTLYVARRTVVENKEDLFTNSMQIPMRDTNIPVCLSFRKYNMNFRTEYSVDGGIHWHIAFDPPSGVPFPIAEAHWGGFAIFSGSSNKVDAIVMDEGVK